MQELVNLDYEHSVGFVACAGDDQIIGMARYHVTARFEDEPPKSISPAPRP